MIACSRGSTSGFLGSQWEVHFVAFGDAATIRNEIDELKTACRLASVTVLPLGLSRAVVRAAGRGSRIAAPGGLLPQPRGLPCHCGTGAGGSEPDVVLVQTVRLLPYLEEIPGDSKRVVHFVDALSSNFERSARVARNPVMRLVYAHESRRLAQLERRALAMADADLRSKPA